MDKNYIVSKANYFIMNSSYDLSIEEQRIILTLASMVQPEDEEFKLYTFKVTEFLKLLGIKDQSKYSSLPIITKELMKKVFEIREGNKTIQVAWLSSAEYDHDTGSISLEFSPRLKPYLLQLKGFFTNYKLSNILKMKSKYSPRLYELLKMNQFNKKGFEIEVFELRKLFKARDIYTNYADFKRRILVKSQKELEKNSDIRFEFEEIKCGRFVDSIKFFIFENKKNEIEIENKSKKKTKKTTNEKKADKVEKDLKEAEKRMVKKESESERILARFELLDKDMKNQVEEKALKIYLDSLGQNQLDPTQKIVYNMKKTKNSFLVKAMKELNNEIKK